METLHLKIKNKETYHHILWFLKKFDPEELELIDGAELFQSIQKELHQELKRVDSGKSTFMELDAFDKELERLIAEYEN